MTPMEPFDVRRVGAEAVRPLRHAVLRGPERPLSESCYPQDDGEHTVHLAVLQGGVVVACATFFPEAHDATPAWRLRGMAADPAHRGLGLGGALLEVGVGLAEGAGVPVLWCNARTVALPFYLSHGFETVGEEFVTAGGVPHYVAVRQLSRNGTST
jgi:predicted GNAT family N-acyltransferase